MAFPVVDETTLVPTFVDAPDEEATPVAVPVGEFRVRLVVSVR